MTVISSCSRSNHRFRKKFQLLLAIFHPLCGSIHVGRPSVVLILVLPRRSSQSNDSVRILTYPPSGCDGMPWSRNQSMPISACTSPNLVPAEVEGHQRPTVWKALRTASAILPVLEHSCSTHFLGEVDWCSTGCTASWCLRLCSITNLAFQAHLRASNHRVLFLCFEWNL